MSTNTIPAVYSFPDAADVAAMVADHIVGIQNSVLSKDSTRRFRIGVSGGSLIGVLNEGLSQRKDIDWENWDIYFADERLVPFDSEASNFGRFKRGVLDQLPNRDHLPNVFPIDESLIDDPQECADNYEKLLIRGFAAKDSVKIPSFDLLMLGCSPDGHIASLFPNHELLREKYAWVAPIEDSPKPPKSRITITLPVICHAHHITFVVEGSTKAKVIKTIMERPDKGLPGSIVNEEAGGRVSWFVDTEALNDCVLPCKPYKLTAPPVESQSTK